MSTLLTLEDQIFNELALEQQAEEQSDIKPFNRFSQVERKKAQEISVATEIPVDQVEAERAAGDPVSETAAKTNGVNFDYALTIDQAYSDGVSAEDLAEIITERKAKGDDMTLSEYMLIQNLMLSDNGVNAYAARTMTNMEIWNNLMQEALEENDQSGVSKVLSFLDVNVLREITIGAFENVTFRSNREGEEIREAFNSLKPDEFREWAKEYLEERKAEGIFSEDSLWNLYKAANDATYLGDDPMAGLNFLFGTADIVTLGGTKIASAAAKGVKSGIENTPQKLLSIYNSRRPVDSVAVISGEVEAGRVASRLVDDVGAQTDEVSAGRTLPEELDPVGGPSARPAGPTVRDGTRKTILTEKLEELNRKGSFGEYVPRTTLELVATKMANSIAERTNDVVVNSRRVIDEGSEDFKVVVRMGKDGSGAPFRRKMDAEEIAKRDPSLKVVKREEGRGWFVEAEERVNVLGLPNAIDRFNKGGFIADAVNKFLGAATVRLGEKIGGKFLQAEAGQALIGDLIKPYQKTIRKVKGKELENLSDFMTQLRDGDLSYMRQAPDSTSFESMYSTMYGARPSRETVEAYEALLDINDTTWQIKSSQRLKRIVAEGGVFVNITDDFSDIGYRVSSVPDGEQILDLAANKSLAKGSLSADAIVYKIPSVFLDHLYVTNVKSTRVLERVDVMPYNAGGPRTNAEFRWFIGAEKQQRLASGNTINAGFKTILGSFGKEQAEIAVDQLNNISKAVRSLMDEFNVDDITDLTLNKARYDELGDIIRRNNTWNKNVTDLEDLQKLASDYNFRFVEDFVAKARDEKVSIREAGQDTASVGESFGEVVGTRINMRRGDTPLMEFGGRKAVNANPVSAIADQFGTEAFGYANRAASQNAVVGWVKLAEKSEGIVTFPKGVPETDYLNRFLEAKVTNTGKYNDLAAQLREQQDVIKRRMNQPTWLSEKWGSFTASATEAIFGKTGFKLDLTKTDPASRLLQVGFYSKFGFFNPDQFVLQGLHSLTIAAISPIHGLKGLGLATPMFALMHPRLNKQARAIGISRLAKSTGIAEEELQKLVQYIDESGRNIIDTQIIELQAPQKFGAASNLTGKAQEAVGSFLDKSTLFFKEGERVTRMTGLITAYLEHRAKRPNIDPLSPDGKLWITNREQDLTFRMTTSSRNFVQSGPMRVPTQWLSFSLRALENIVVGRNFTAGERARMFAVMGPMFGLTGLGVGQMAGYFTEQLGYDPDDTSSIKVFNRLKYGLIDTILSETFSGLSGKEIETAYATRVAPVDQLVETYKKLFDEGFITTLFGPSGEISSDMIAVASNAVGAMLGGRPQMVREDLTQLVRNLSTVDKAVKIRELIESGNYRSRTRKLAVGNLEPEYAATLLFGATPAPVQNYYDYQEMVFKKNAKYRDLSKRMRDKATLALNLLTEGDESDMIRGTKLWNEINDEIWSSSLSNQLKVSLQKSLVNVASVPDIMKNAVRLGLEYDAQLLQQQTQ